MLNRTAWLAMSTSVLKALPDCLKSKDTHLVFSIYCIFTKSLLSLDPHVDVSIREEIKSLVSLHMCAC